MRSSILEDSINIFLSNQFNNFSLYASWVSSPHNFQASHLRARCTARFRTVGDWTSIGNFQAILTLTFMKRWRKNDDLQFRGCAATYIAYFPSLFRLSPPSLLHSLIFSLPISIPSSHSPFPLISPLSLLLPVLFFSVPSWIPCTRSHTTASRKMVTGLPAARFGNGLRYVSTSPKQEFVLDCLVRVHLFYWFPCSQRRFFVDNIL